MGFIKAHGGKHPRLGARVYLAHSAAIIGDVELGDDVSVWYNSVVRSDCHSITIGDRTNIQDNCAIHVTAGKYATVLEEEVTLGHGAIVHGAVVRKGALIGIRATILDGADVGASAFIGAGALVVPRTVVPPRTLWLGSPAKLVRHLTDEEVKDLEHFHKNYLHYKKEAVEAGEEWAG